MRSMVLHFLGEVKYIVRNPIFFVILTCTPILLLTISLLFIPTERVLESIKIGILGEDQSYIGQYLSDFILGFLKQENVVLVENREEAWILLEEGKIHGLIIIPMGFSARMMLGQQTELSYVPSSASLIESVTIYKFFSTVLSEMQFGAIIELQQTSTMDPAPFIPVPHMKIEGINQNRLDYPDVMAPGILAFVILSTMLIGITGSVSREKDRGILEGFRITPSSRGSYVMGKFFAHACLGIIQTIALIVGSRYILQIGFEGSMVTVGLFLGIGMLTYLGMGLLISILSANSDIAMGIAAALVFLMFLGGGVFFPISQMPKVMQSVALFLPITPLAESLRKIMIAGRAISDVRNELILVFAYLGCTLITSLLLFKTATK